MNTAVTVTPAMGGRAVLITLTGNFQADTPGAFRTACAEAPPGVEVFAVNMSHVDSINLPALAALNALSRGVEGSGRVVRLDGCNRRVRAALADAGLDQLFRISE